MTQSAASPPIFTPSDIRALVRGPTDDERASVALKLCKKMDVELSKADRAAANEILRVMAGDAAELVRRALAVTLRASDVLPRDVALRLAEDVESIATPILSFSPVFSEAGLVISLDRFRESQRVTRAVAYRDALPAAVTEKLMHLVTEDVRRVLQARHGLSAPQAAALSTGAQERAPVDILDEIAAAPDMEAFGRHLHKQNRLSSSLLLRAATSGYMRFVEHGLAVLAAVPHHRAWLLIHDAGGLGFKAIFERAGLPQRLFTAFRIALDTFHAMAEDGKALDPATFQARLLERFLTQAHGAPREDLDYLLDRLDQLNTRRNDQPVPLVGAA